MEFLSYWLLRSVVLVFKRTSSVVKSTGLNVKEILIGFVWKVCKKSFSKAFFNCVASRIVCVCIFFLYQTFTMSTIWWTWKSASNVSRLQKNASVSVRTKCNISQSRWMSFLKVCVHYYVFYEGILYNISMICFRKNVLFF